MLILYIMALSGQVSLQSSDITIIQTIPISHLCKDSKLLPYLLPISVGRHKCQEGCFQWAHDVEITTSLPRPVPAWFGPPDVHVPHLRRV